MKKLLSSICLIFISCVLLQACSSTGTSLKYARAEFQNQNYRGAFKNLLPLAKKGNTQAQYAIGYMYYNGLGVDKDFQMAELWLHKSADKNNMKAQQALAMLSKAKASEPFPAPHSLYAMNQAKQTSIG